MKKNTHLNKIQTGFTLIELLVVIAIIGLLASIILVSLNGARLKARDTKRIADNKQIMTALELYYVDNQSVYPASGGATNGPNAAWSNSSDASWITLQTLLAPYISKLPIDPTNQSGWAASGYYSYSYFSCSRAYMLVYKLENAASQISPGVNVCGTFYGPIQYVGAVTIGQGAN